MDDCVGLEGVAEFPDRAVHHILMERPFEERGENDADSEAREAPEDEKSHVGVCGNEANASESYTSERVKTSPIV